VTIVLRITVPAIAAGLLLSGCGSSSGTTASGPGPAVTTNAADAATTSAAPSAAATTAASVKPRGSKWVVDKKNGYQVAIPAGFVRITSKSQLNKVYKAGAEATGAKTGITQQLLNKSLKMIAVKATSTDTINVVVTAAGGLTADQLPQAEPAIREQVAKLGVKKVAFKELTLGGDPALRTAYTVKLQGRSVNTIQYITVHDDKAYTLTFSQPVRLAARIETQTTGSWKFL
jgi:hypothetical protein